MKLNIKVFPIFIISLLIFMADNNYIQADSSIYSVYYTTVENDSSYADTTSANGKISDIELLGTAGNATGIGALYYEDSLVYTYENSRVNCYDISSTENIRLKATTLTGTGVRNIASAGNKLIIARRDTKPGAYDSCYPYYANLFESGISDISEFNEYSFTSNNVVSSLFKSICVTYKLSEIKSINVRKASPNDDGTFTNSITFNFEITYNGKKTVQPVTFFEYSYPTQEQATDSLKSIYTGKDGMQTAVNHDFFLEIDWEGMTETDLNIECTPEEWNENGGFDICTRKSSRNSIYYSASNSPAIYEGTAHFDVWDGNIELKKRIGNLKLYDMSLLLKVNGVENEANIPIFHSGDFVLGIALKKTEEGLAFGLTNNTDTVYSDSTFNVGEWYNTRATLNNYTLTLYSQPKEMPDEWTKICSLYTRRMYYKYLSIGLETDTWANIEIDNLFLDTLSVDDNTYRKGFIYIVDKETNKIEKTYRTDLKCSEISICDNIMALTCLAGINYYDISNPTDLKLVKTFRLPVRYGWFEPQGSTIAHINGKSYHIASTYIDGIIIHDITDMENITLVGHFPTDDILYEAGNLRRMTFDICTKGNKAYQTLCTHKNYQFTGSDKRGILVWDLSDITNPAYKPVYIDDDDRAEFSGGDPVPNRIDIGEDFIVCNNDSKGVIFYTLDENGEAVYEGCYKPDENPAISSVLITDNYLLLKGSKLYVCDHRNMNPDIVEINPNTNGVKLRATYSERNNKIENVLWTCNGQQVNDSIAEFTGLLPDTPYSAEFTVEDSEGKKECVSCKFTTLPYSVIINATISNVNIGISSISAEGGYDIPDEEVERIWWTCGDSIIEDSLNICFSNLTANSNYTLEFNVETVDGYTGTATYTFRSPSKKKQLEMASQQLKDKIKEAKTVASNYVWSIRSIIIDAIKENNNEYNTVQQYMTAIENINKAMEEASFIATDISNIPNESINRKSFYYNINGQRVAVPQKGHIYLKDGKKIFLR